MKLPTINEIDFNESGEWPLAHKAFTVLLLCTVVCFLGYNLILKDKDLALQHAERKEETLKKALEEKHGKAINLEVYKKQVHEMEGVFKSMLQQLPRKSEVADLLIDISSAGLVNGLAFELFRPGGESPKDFYAELPIEMKVTGSYHQFGAFVSVVASLPRIVTLHDFVLVASKDESEQMVMSLTAKTYRYFDIQ